MTIKTNDIYLKDCVKGMQQIEDGAVDLVFADPPFNIGYDYDVYDDSRSADEYIDWSRDWMKQVHRVLKPSGTFWLAIGDDYAAELKVLMQRELGFHCRSWVIWYYTFGVNCKYKFSRSHTHLFHMVKDPKEFTFNADDPAIRIPSARQLVYGDKRANPKGRLPDDTWIRVPDDTWYLRPQDLQEGFCADQSTWYFPRVCGTFKQREGWHGCQMPEQLLARIVRACSNENDLVLDPFGGSGTTLAVARKLGREFLGFEISDEYFDRVRARLQEINVGDPLEGSDKPLSSAPSTKAGVTREAREKNMAERKLGVNKTAEKKVAKKKKSAAKKRVKDTSIPATDEPTVDTAVTEPKPVRKKKSVKKKTVAKKKTAKKKTAKKKQANIRIDPAQDVVQKKPGRPKKKKNYQYSSGDDRPLLRGE